MNSTEDFGARLLFHQLKLPFPVKKKFTKDHTKTIIFTLETLPAPKHTDNHTLHPSFVSAILNVFTENSQYS